MRLNLFRTSVSTVFVPVSALFVALLSTGAARAQAAFRKAEVFPSIERAFVQGEISFSQRHLYRVAALKDRDLLPVRFRDFVVYGRPSRGCYTAALVEAMQDFPFLEREVQVEIERLLLPPPDLNYTLEVTTPYPIRVTYDDVNHQTKAQTVLDSAVTAYQDEVTSWGFWEPPIESGATYFRFYLEPTGMGGGGYTAPYEDVTSTPHADSYAYCVIDPGTDSWALPAVTAHEFNHACQAAMDMMEVMAFWENTATYIMSRVFPANWLYTQAFFEYFQSYPWYPLESENTPTSDLFAYGAALWVYFMEEMYANHDPSWIAQVWQGTVQNGWTNEPDYFDVLSTMLQSEGGFAEMVRTFAQYRFFVGNDADGRHLQNAQNWGGAEVAKDANWDLDDLPLLNQSPETSHRPQTNGCNYIVGDINGMPLAGIEFRFSGSVNINWNVDVVKVASNDTTYQRMAVDAQGQGTVTESASSGDRLVMVVCQIGGSGYDPDWGGGQPGVYTHTIRYAADPPTVISVDPNQILQGSQGVAVTVHGTNFLDGPGLSVQVSGAGVAVTQPVFVSETELRVQMNVEAAAALGPRDVVVTNPDGQSGVGTGLLSIVDEITQQDGGVGDGGAGSDGGGPSDGPRGGCNCRTGRTGQTGRTGRAASANSGTPWVVLFLLAFGLCLRRRKSRGR